VKVAAVQFEPAFGEKEANTEALLRLATEAAGRGARLIVLPEMATTGYVFRSREEIGPYVEPVPGPTTERFGALARSRRVSLVVGLPEVCRWNGAFYNSAVLIGPNGEVAATYRKTHSFHCDTLWAAEGDLGLPVLDGPWPGPLGILICMDAGFFETARVQALAGARVIAFPTNWLRAAPSPEWRARAAENGVYLIAADRWGEERGTVFAGGSCVIGPAGEVMAWRERGDGVVTADIDPDRAGLPAAFGLPGGKEAAVRRPDLYHTLLRHPYLWPESFVFGGLGRGRFTLGALAGPRWASQGATGTRRGLDASLLHEAITAALRASGGPPAGLLALPPLPVEPGEEERAAGALAEVASRTGFHLAVSPAVVPVAATPPAAAPAAALSRATPPAPAPPSARSAGRVFAPPGEVWLVGPKGLTGRYRSPHVPPHLPDGPGDAGAAPFPVFDLPFARVGLLHAADLLLPEPARLLAKEGADVVLVSGPWPPELDHLVFLQAERAESNDCWMAVATDRGSDIFSAAPGTERGEVAEARLGGGKGAGPGFTVKVTVGETSPGSFSRRKDRLRRLQPRLYSGLVSPVATVE
jgi:predicted amidohydrolase